MSPYADIASMTDTFSSGLILSNIFVSCILYVYEYRAKQVTFPITISHKIPINPYEQFSDDAEGMEKLSLLSEQSPY